MVYKILNCSLLKNRSSSSHQTSQRILFIYSPRSFNQSIRATNLGMLLTFLTALAAGSTLVGAYPTEDYDYVIIGSGPGGGSLAANLALSGASVFLIEAGGDGSQDIVQQIPALAGRAAENAPNSWQFFVEHYSNRTQAFRDRKYTYLRNNGSYYSGVNPPSNSTP